MPGAEKPVRAGSDPPAALESLAATAVAPSMDGGPSTGLIRIGAACVTLAVVVRPFRPLVATAIRSLIATARTSAETTVSTTAAANALDNCEAPPLEYSRLRRFVVTARSFPCCPEVTSVRWRPADHGFAARFNEQN
jgi:hypothetical protein